MAIERANKPKNLLSKAYKFVSSGMAFPNAKSEQDITVDGIQFFTRYRYAGTVQKNTRPFCREMIRRNKIYRKEDIIRMETTPVNEGWGAKGANTYSVWFYKGGGSCRHRWNREVYAQFEDAGLNINDPRVKPIAQRRIKKYGYDPKKGVLKNDKKVAQRTREMKNRGFLEPKNFTTPVNEN